MEEGLCSYGKQKTYKFIMPGPSLRSREVRVVHSATSSNSTNRSTNVPIHPRHRLPVSALALEALTQFAGWGSAEGILYTGGRDGMIVGWDLGLQMKMSASGGTSSRHPFRMRWERLTGWMDDSSSVDEDDEYATSNGDVLGYAQATSRGSSSNGADQLGS